jgi:hypothetical protein
VQLFYVLYSDLRWDDHIDKTDILISLSDFFPSFIIGIIGGDCFPFYFFWQGWVFNRLHAYYVPDIKSNTGSLTPLIHLTLSTSYHFLLQLQR